MGADAKDNVPAYLDNNGRSCFTCKFQSIRETSYEWIENFCRADGGHCCSPYSCCEKYQPCETDGEES